MCVSRRETLMDPRHAEVVAARAPRGIARHYDGDHFEIYHRPLVDSLLADQTAFLREYLHVEDSKFCNNDIRFVEFASGLSAASGPPSLCGEWSNHDVLAHLVIGYRAHCACWRPTWSASAVHSTAPTPRSPST
ncbi:hypothetical protein I551_5896 [Mycobacterium ulcerans str. Harvey]|uniref:Mycothiol-dependent maleylpyruvate isomerase metal-binding domain-containing protein n=1 Tax=Mycobacterium ulcerans str. Harvey TaxID=1299332 RepID=A0ABN0QSL9_MYCUL|nr:hypothetical protein I551_5896 [Mycobacterium ulcerans str. Harvey]